MDSNSEKKYYEEDQKFGFFNMLRKCLRDVANISNDEKCLQIVLNNFREFFMKEKENVSFSMNEETRKQVINSLNPEQYDILEYEPDTSNYEVVDLTTKLRQLECALEKIDEFDMETVKDYILIYMSTFVEDISFGIGYRFTSSSEIPKTTRNLYNLGVFPYKEDSYYLSMYNPFFLSSICYLAFAIVRNYKSINSTPELREMKYEIFISYAKKCFTRYTCDPSGVDCKYFLDDNGIVSSAPMKMLSSLEYLSPLVLFENIASYISRKIENHVECDPLEIDIAIFGGKSSGYASAIDANKEDFNNLLKALVSWYTYTGSKTKINLSLTNILNSENNSEERMMFEYKLEGNYGKLEVKEIDFRRIEEAPIKNIKNIIGKNNILFFLDCPYLSYCGQYNIFTVFQSTYNGKYKDEMRNNFGSIDIYKFFGVIDWISFSCMNKDGKSLAPGINKNRLYRFMNKAFTCRESLWEEIRNSQKCDEIYFYFSENITDSILACYPKEWEIFENNICDNNFFFYSHSKSGHTRLHYNEEGTSLKMRIWSFLKNLPREYTCGSLRKSLEELFGKTFANQENYLEFLRDIFIRIDVVSNKEINISLEFSDRLEVLLKQMGFADVDKTMKNIHAKVLGLIEFVCSKSIFSDSHSFEDEEIKKAFENCIYENIVDLNALLFLNIYKKRHEYDSLTSVKINFSKHIFTVPDDNYVSKKKTDKSFYSDILNCAESGSKLSAGASYTLHRTGKIFGTTISGMIQEIKKADAKTGLLIPKQRENLESINK